MLKRKVRAIKWICLSEPGRKDAQIKFDTGRHKIKRLHIKGKEQKFVNGEKIILPVVERDVYDDKVLFKSH